MSCWKSNNPKNASQQSVQPTGGILPHFQAFFWLRAFSCSPAESQPTHQRLPITCSCQGLEGKSCKVPRESLCLSRYFFSSSLFFLFWDMLRRPRLSLFLRRGSSCVLIQLPFWKVPQKHKNENSRLEKRRSRFGWGVSPFYQNFICGNALAFTYAGMPSSAILARTSSFGATLLGTFLRTKRVMSFSTPSFIKAYLANCL